MCGCGCNTCETDSTALMLNESKAPRTILSEGLKHHIDNDKPLTEHLYRAGSRAYFDLFAEARSLYSRGILEFTNEDDLALLTETNLGHFGLLERISTVSKRRAGAELKQKLKGVRSDGFGKYDATVYGLDSNGKRVELKSLNDLNKYNKFELAENKKVPLDFPIELNEQMDLEDELANMEFGMDYDQLGDNEKEWVRDEIDNMEMNEGTFNSPNHIAIFDGPDGMVDVYKTSEGFYFQTDNYDGEASNAKEAAKWLKDNGFVRLQAGSLDESINENEYYVTRNLGRGQGKSLVKSVESDFNEPRVFSKEEAEKYIKQAQSGGAIPGQMVAYWVSDKDMNRVDEVTRYSGFNRNPEDPDSEPFNPTGAVAEFKEELRALFGKFKGDLRNPEFIKGAAQIMNNWKPLLRSQLDESVVTEAKKKKAKKKDNRPIGKPMRDTSGGKAYKVYVKDPKTKKIKTVRFGSGGLRAKINDSKARAAFAKRHKCSTKKDRTKAGYWSCRLPRYAKLLGLKSSFSGFW